MSKIYISSYRNGYITQGNLLIINYLSFFPSTYNFINNILENKMDEVKICSDKLSNKLWRSSSSIRVFTRIIVAIYQISQNNPGYQYSIQRFVVFGYCFDEKDGR